MTSTLTVLDIETRHEHREQSGHGDRTHDLSVTVIWAQGQCTLAKVDESLGYTHTEQVVGVLRVVDG